ncbi:MAG: cobyrinate a,c-diamide synthase [Alistipes sp.]|jgi:cobyrinic acid a,c-diamide synthase|nr:cobyrinate a,c-diamide synthase [Alistipes sp.]
MFSSFLIGAATSGSGKTTLTLGLLRALARRGLVVQPFKCGPDYIDPMFHRLATSAASVSCAESVNLDLWMGSEEHVRELFARYGADADVCVTEGVMGLFDGWRTSEGSSAEVARVLGLPIVLVVDARATGYSVAPLLFGFKNFRPEATIAGVIFNRVGSPSHYAHLAEAARDAGIETLGWLPRCDDFSAPSRYLGLSIEGIERFSSTIDAIADAVERHVDIERLLELTQQPRPPKATKCDKGDTLQIAVARDEAFNFTYLANLDRLGELGRLTFFSPLSDAAPPEGADLIYLPGGYPELFADRLSDNLTMREAIRDYAERGGRILAECGGMLYLCRSLDGRPMCGVLPLEGSMEGAKLHLGYREVHYGGLRLRGHEFHYSHTTGEADSAGGMASVARQFTARGAEVATPLYRHKNVIAGYTHLYWAESGGTLEWFD